MSDTPSPLNAAPTVSVPPLKPYKQWRAESGIEEDDLNSLVKYSGYQKVHALKHGEYSEDIERKIQEALIGQAGKRGYFEGKNEQEREGILTSLVGIPDPDFNTASATVNAAYPSVTADDPDEDLATYAKFRDFSKTLPEELTQDQSADFETLKAEATAATSRLYEKAKIQKVRAGQTPIVAVTRQDEKGGSYLDFEAGELGSLTPRQAVAQAIESGDLPSQAAFAALNALEPASGLKINRVQLREIDRVKDIVNGIERTPEYLGVRDVVNDYADYLADKEAGETDAEDDAFAEKTLRNFTNYLDLITDGAEPPKEGAAKQALEELAYDSAIQNKKINFNDKDLSKNIRFTEGGVPIVHPALLGNSDKFNEALAGNPDITAEQKRLLTNNRKSFLSGNFDHYDKLLSDSPTQGEAWRDYRNKARAASRKDVDILDGYLKNPNNFKEFSARMSGIGSSVLDSVGMLVATIPALAGADWAQDYLVESAKKSSSRRQVAEAFGRPFGIGQDIMEQVAPMVADIGATALLSVAATPAAGAAYLAARQGVGVTGKAVAKSLTAGFLRRGGFTEAGESVAEAAIRLTDVGDLIRKGTTAADAERIIKGYNQTIASKLNIIPPLFLTSANRSAGGMYGSVYNSLPDNLSAEEKHDQALGAALMAGATTGIITTAFSMVGLGGMENVLLRGATAGQLRRAVNAAAGKNAVRDISNTDLSSAIARGVSETFTKLGITRAAAAKRLGIDTASEAAEEGLDEFIQTFVTDAFTGSDTPLLERLQQSMHAALIGGVFGAGIPSAKAAIKQFTPLTSTETEATMGAQEELFQNISSQLENTGSPLTAKIVKDLLSVGMSQRGATGTRFARRTRDEAIALLSAPPTDGDQMLMGPIINARTEGVRPATGTTVPDEGPPTPSPELAAAEGTPAATEGAGALPASPEVSPVSSVRTVEEMQEMARGNLGLAADAAPEPIDLGSALAGVSPDELGEAAEAEMSQGFFDFFDDVASVVSGSPNEEGKTTGSQRTGKKSVDRKPLSPYSSNAEIAAVERQVDSLFDSSAAEAESFVNGIQDKGQKKAAKQRLTERGRYAASFGNIKKKAVSKRHASPTTTNTQQAVGESKVAEAAEKSGVVIAYVDGPKDLSRYTGGIPTPKGKTVFTVVSNGIPVVVVDESTVRGKPAAEIAEEMRKAVLHAATLNVAAETGAYTDSPPQDILEEGGLLSKATEADPSIGNASSPAEQLSRIVFAIGDSSLGLNLDNHPKLEAFLKKVLSRLSKNLQGADPDPVLDSVIEGNNTLLQDRVVAGRAVASNANTGVPRLNPSTRFDIIDQSDLDEQQKLHALTLGEYLITLRAIPAGVRFIMDFKSDAAFSNVGGFIVVNPTRVLKGLLSAGIIKFDGNRYVITNPKLAKKILRKELGHEQVHSAVDYALTPKEREAARNSFTITELVEQASSYYSDPAKKTAAINALNDPNNTEHESYKYSMAEEKIRADVQDLIEGETSDEVLAELSGNEVKRSFYEKYLKRAARIYRKKVSKTGNPQYAAALKRISNSLRDMRLGYIPTQHSHGGIFSLDKPYASIQMLESIFRGLEPMAEGYEDIANDIDAASLDIDEGVATIIGDEGIDLTTLTEGESDSVNLSQFGFSDPETSLAQFKAEAIRVKGMTKAGVTVGTRSPSGTNIKEVFEGGTNPENRITLEDAAKSPNAFLKNALILTQYPSVRGILSRMLKDPDMVNSIKKEKNFTDAQWSEVVNRINRAFSEKVSATFNGPDIFKTSEAYTTAKEARDAAIKAVNTQIDKLFFSTAPDGKKEYVTWLFKQIGFTGRGHATPEKKDSSSVKAIRDALSSMTEGISITKTDYPLFTEGYTPPPKTKKWTPSIKELREVVKGIRAYESARDITEANNATTTSKKKTMSDEIEKISPAILDANSAGVIYDALLTVGRTNLKVLYDIFPKDIVEVARLWYDGANIIARQLSGDTAAQDVGGVRAEAVQPLFGPNGRGLVAKRFGERVLEKASAILAVFSPQKDWLMNVSLAHRAMQVMYDGFTNPSGMVWDERLAARFLARAGQPEIIEEEDGKVKYTGRAVPVVDDAGMPVLDSNGLQTFTNWDDTRAKKLALTQAAKVNAALTGKTFEQIGGMTLNYSYEDENGKKVTKELDGVALHARFIRMYSEVHHPTDFPVVTPTGEFKGKSLSAKTGAPLKLAWGGYVTIEKAIRIYTSTGSSDTYETDNVLQTISAELGDAHKVRSFYNNIVNPASVDGHVTMDTHAVAALLAKALSGAMAEVSHNFGTSLVGSSKVNGVSGLYAANAEAYRGIATDFDLLARELQSITWESVRILFPPEFKRLKQATDALNAVWDSFARETPYTPAAVAGQPTPSTITLETLDDVWEQIIRVVWTYTRKGKPIPSLAELRSSAETDNLPNGTTRRYEDYNGLGFPAWDTRRESMRLLLTEQDKAKETLDDVVEDFLDVSGYLNNPDTLNSSFGQELQGANMDLVKFRADQTPPIFYSAATLQRAIQNVSTDIVGETTEEILTQALRAKVILASYGYKGFAETINDPEVSTISTYFKSQAAKTSTTDPRNGGENGLTYKDAFEPEFMRFFRNAPVLRETIKRNRTGFTLLGDNESQLEGFVVSPRKSTEKFLTEDFTDDELRQYIVDHADILSLPGARLGGWYDPATQRFTLDVSFALTEREDAITIALASDQDAIYDLQNKYDIRTKYIDPDTGESSFVVTRIDGRDPQQVIGEVVPTTGDAAIFASERSVRDKGRMGFASDGGSQAGGAGVTDVGTSRAISEAMEINRAAKAGEATQGNFGTVSRLFERFATGHTFRTGRFKSIDEKSFRDKIGPINDRGAEHRVWFDQKASNRVFKYAYNFGLTKILNPFNEQAGYVGRVAASNILFEDKQRIEYVVHQSTKHPQDPVVGYVISQPFLDSKNRRKMKQEEINATMEALGWRLFLPEGASSSRTFSSPSISLPEGGTVRIFVYDLHNGNAYAETVTDEDGNVVEKFTVIDVPIGIRFPKGTAQEVIDKYPSVAELLAEFPDPASFGIAVPSLLPEIKRAEAASKLFDAIAFSEDRSDTLLSQFGNTQDAEYLTLAADPEKNKEALQRMVNEAAERSLPAIPEDHLAVIHKAPEETIQSIQEEGLRYRGRLSNTAHSASRWADLDLVGGLDGRWSTVHTGKEPIAVLFVPLDEHNQHEGRRGATPTGIVPASQVARIIPRRDPVTYDESGNVIPLSQRFDTGKEDIRFSQFGFRDSGSTLLDQRMGTTSPDNQSMFNDLFDVLEIPILASGTYQKPDSFFARLAMGEFDPRYRKMLQTQRAFNVSAASYIEQERKALIREVEEAYGSSKDIGANLLISRAFGSTDVTLPEETVAKLRKERRDKLVAAQAAATPEAVEAYVANLMAMDGTIDPLDADIRARNEIRTAAIKQAKDEAEADDVAARQVHRDAVVKAQNAAIRSLERQAPEVLKRIKRIRLFVDEQSRRIKAGLKDNSELRIIIDNQLGIYVTRSYQFFSDEGYRDAIRNPENKNYSTYEAERQLARAFFEEQYIEDRTTELMESEFGLDEDGAKAKAQEEVDGRAANGRRIGEEMMIMWLDSLEGKAPITEATTSPQGKDDLSIRVVANNLKQRKSVPEPLRKLLNELDEEEGIERMLRTAATVSAIHSNQKTLSNIYRFGRSDKAPENRWLLNKKEIDALPYEEQREYSMIPSKGSAGVSAVNPLVGMYAPNDLVEALNNLSTKQHIDSQTAASQQTINAMMRGMTQATGMSMAVNVLLSVGHYFRNVLGYTSVAAVTGSPSLIWKSMSSLSRESKFLLPERLRKSLDMTEEKYNVERLRLVALNIDNDSVRASTLKDMLSGKTSMADVQKEIMSLSDAAKTATGKALGAIGDSLTQLEQATETFFKIAYFYDTLEMLDSAVAEGTGTINGLPVSAFNNETALYQEAARQTLLVLPSHSQTMPFVTEFTKSGFGLMLAPFLRFKSEMIRTPINNMKLAMQEINSGNSVLRARGIARLTGSFVVLTASTALPMLISKVLGGLDDEDDEALRKSMPSYLRDHSFFYFMFNGELRSIDLTYVNPYSGIGDAFNAMYRAAVKGDILAPAKGVAQFFSQNFLDDQILFGALRAATENRDPTTGLPIYEVGLDTPSEAAVKLFKFVGLEAYGPRVLTDTIKVIEAAKEGETSPGYGVSDIMLNGVMPFRIHTIDPDQQFRRYLFEHRQQYQRADGGLNELLGRKAIGPDRVEDIYDETVKNKKRANEDLLRTALAFTGEGLGVSSADADTMMRSSGVSKTRISQLNNRAMDRVIPSKDFVDKLLSKPEGKARGQILYDHILQQPRYYELDVR